MQRKWNGNYIIKYRKWITLNNYTITLNNCVISCVSVLHHALFVLLRVGVCCPSVSVSGWGGCSVGSLLVRVLLCSLPLAATSGVVSNGTSLQRYGFRFVGVVSCRVSGMKKGRRKAMALWSRAAHRSACRGVAVLLLAPHWWACCSGSLPWAQRLAWSAMAQCFNATAPDWWGWSVARCREMKKGRQCGIAALSALLW